MVSLRKVVSSLLDFDNNVTREAKENMVNSSMDLAELLRDINVDVKGSLDVEITGVAYDSRRVKPGYVFVCITGLQADGHSFAAQAVEHGAKALVVDRFLDLPVTQIKIKDTRRGLGLLAAAFYGWPAQKLRVCGVTGTNGKTTVTHLIEHILNYSGRNTGLIGTLGARVGGSEFPGNRTTPEASDLQELLARMLECQAEYAVMEVSSHALDLHRVEGCEYDIAVFTNLTQDHLDYHKTMEEYLAAKTKLFVSLNQDSHKTGRKYAVINMDDPAAGQLKAQTTVKTFTYGINQPADYHAVNILNRPEGVSFDLLFPGGQVSMNMKTPGLFSVYNTLAAFTVGSQEGLEPELIARVLSEVQGVPGRFEPVRGNQPFGVIVDYAHTPDSLENVIRTARQFAKGRIITVFGCGGDRDRSKRPVMGHIAANLSDLAIVTSDNPRTEDPLQIIADIKPGLAEITPDFLVEPDRREAIRLALNKASDEDIVIIAGKGHENYQEINGKKHFFDDRVVAREYLEELGYGTNND